MQKIAVVLFVGVMLAGCGDKDAKYPGDFMLGADDAPSGLLLYGPGMEGWDQYQEAVGATSNPGPLDPIKVAEVLGTPELVSAHAAVFLSISEQAGLISAAVEITGSAGAKDWLREEVVKRCFEGQYFFVEGDHVAMVMGVGGLSQEKVDDAAAKIRKSSQADDLCDRAMKAAAAQAVALDIGDNGPYSIDEPTGAKWFKLDAAKEIDMVLAVSSTDDTALYFYDTNLALIASDDSNYPSIEQRLTPGTYYARVTEAGQDDTVDSFTLTLELTAA